MNRKEIAEILASAGLRPQHHFGQNFMIDQSALAAIVDAGEVTETDIILEVGPGVGNLTRLLATRACRGHVLAVDIDEKLLHAAKRHHAALSNVTWMHADVLAGKHEIEPRVMGKLREILDARPQAKIKLVSNLPYNAASPLVAELLVMMWHELRAQQLDVIRPSGNMLLFSRLAFTVQWEVGLRMIAEPGTRDYGPLGVLIQSMAHSEIAKKIAAGAFWPPPKIQSGLVVVTPQREQMPAIRDVLEFQRFLSGIFSHRRQTLGNALKHHFGEKWTSKLRDLIEKTGFNLSLRPDNLRVDQLSALEASIHEWLNGAADRC